MDPLTELRDNRRRGLVLDEGHFSRLQQQIAPEWRTLEHALRQLEQRQPPADVLSQFKREAKQFDLSDPDKRASSLLIEAVARNRLGQPRQALTSLRQAHALEQNAISPQLQVDILREQGLIYSWQGNSEVALSKYLLALNLSLRFGDDTGQALIWTAIARLYMEMLATEQAMHYFQSAFPIINQWTNSRERIRLLKDMAEVQLSLNKLEECQQTLHIITESERDSQDT